MTFLCRAKDLFIILFEKKFGERIINTRKRITRPSDLSLYHLS